MDELTSGVDPDELMDLDEAEASDLDEDDEDVIDDPMPSPLQLPSSGPASTATSTASSPPTNDDTPPVFNFTGKPLSIKRGRGRPRREGGKPAQRRQSNGARIKRWRQPGYSRGVPRRVRSFERGDFEFSSVTPSPGEDTMLDSESGALIINERHAHPTPEEVPYAPEQWPGKVCAFCNLGERSQLGQGEMLRLTCPEGFTPQRIVSEPQDLQIAEHIPERDFGDKSPRGPVTCRRQKSFNKCRHPSLASEYVDELTIIGYIEEPVMTSIFEITGHFYVHRTCAMWSNGVVRTENLALDNVGQAVLLSLSKKCSHCSHFGASVSCKRDGCSKVYHYPCSTASGAFQEVTMLLLFCTQHLSQVSIMCESSVCYTCKLLGDISNLMYCSLCGEHYHGTCVGLAQLPGVRAGWQCRRCRVCQVCRMSGDESKLMACEQCDKGYHSMCQRPTVATIPKYGWKCRCCRVCGDCGSRTPGAGLSSRWHAHYTVCDSCYQQRNKGFSCPLCHRAYRAHAHREMVQCAMCRKFVHGTCDPDADLGMYHQRKETNPEYEYVCSNCKNITQGRLMLAKRNSIDDGGDSMSASQESLIDDYDFDVERCISEETVRSTGLGRGKPYSASKIAKKRLGIGTGAPGRPKGVGKGTPGKVGFMKRQRMTEFGRKRGPKTKMRGIFGVPGVGLQRPVSDGSKNDEEPGIENRLILCSAKDKFVLTQDMCVMCGALGTDQEGCLISCVQCGQCYHPYCVNVKVTKVILQKGWRCLDCTVCEGCGQRHDESRLILCDDCDISFHIYCMDPPLDYVPDGNWKCKWCALCQTCGTTDPGFNSNWMNSFTECGPCASHVSCPSCLEPYIEGDLIMQCVQCERWLHGACDSIKNDLEAEKCAEEGYNCVLCRPADVPPPHLLPCPTPKPPTPTKSPEVKSSAHYYVDGVYLSETGHTMIKSLCMEQQITRKKRKKMATLQDKEAGIMATIESVIAGSSSDNGLQDNAKLELVDVKEEPQEIYKEGMIWTKEDGPPPEGFTIFTMESGVGVLRRKRQRNLQKLGIGGFLVRVRGIRGGQDNDDIDMLPGQTTPLADPLAPPPLVDADKPRRKPIRRKPKSKLSETFPSYLQEAFFGRELLDSHKDFDSSSGSDEERGKHQSKTIQLSQDEMKAVAAVTAKQEKVVQSLQTKHPMMNVSERTVNKAPLIPKEEEESDPEDLSVLALSGDLLVDTDLVNTIMNEDDDELTKTTDALDGLTDSNLPDAADITETLGASSNSKDTKDELSDILGPHFNLDIPNINSKDVEDIFKGVLTDESQESQESNVFPITATNSVFPPAAPTQQPPVTHQITPAVRPTTLPNVTQNNLNSPMSFPPQSPYHSEYSNSPQFSPAFSEPPSPWVSANDSNDFDNPVTPSTHNQRSSEKMKADEGLGSGATISAVLYANMNHPEWKSEFPAWSDRYKQIIKKWRTLSNEHKAPYLQQAKDNRSALRMKKQQQISKESASSPSVVSKTVATPAVVVVPPTHQAPAAAPVSEDPEKTAQQIKSAREAEQERNWKHLQAMRQQQQQQQQNVIQEQRVQAIARVHRQISDPGQPFISDQVGVLQVTTQEINSAPSSPSPRNFNSIGIKSPTFTHPASVTTARPTTPSPQQQQPSSSSSSHDFLPNDGDPFSPKPLGIITTTSTQPTAIRLSSDSYPPQTSTPRPQFSTPRPALQGMMRPEGAEINRQLRDLLQRQQQFKKLDEQLLPGKGQQRVWPPPESLEVEHSVVSQSQNDATFRHPLPPSMRPRIPVPQPNVIRQQGVVGLRMQVGDSRLQGLDPRMKLIIQHQQRAVTALPPQQQFQGANARFQLPVRPALVEQYEHIQRQVFQPRVDQLQSIRLPNPQVTIQKTSVVQSPALSTVAANDANSTEQEIPDNVTAELEKLEQDGGMVELQSVGDILGGLPDDDDELLAEMGNDFNILEYADPELDALTGGEKTNILDTLDLVEPEPVKEEKKASRSSLIPPHPITTTAPHIKTEPSAHITSPIAIGGLQPPPLAVSQLHHQQQQQQAPLPPSPQLTQQQIHQQMLQQVQQAAALGRPIAPGTKLMSPDGIIGTVTPNNNVTLKPAYNQRLIGSQMQLQNQKQLQMRLSGLGQGPRLPIMHGAPVGMGPTTRMNVAAPPPPPYPGPPPPYPGSTTSQDQPLLLEDLLEQEKREQEKQLQIQPSAPSNQEVPTSTVSTAFLNDHDFERLKADVFNSGPLILGSNTAASVPAQGLLPVSSNQGRQQSFQTQATASGPTNMNNQWQAPQAPVESTPRVPTYNANLLPAPPLPPEHIVTDQDKQTQMVYEQWLKHQNAALTQQLKFYETEVQKLRKIRKSLNSKQRGLRKSGNQLGEADAMELQRISAEQGILQKQLESSRKQFRQHGMLMQEYRNKQQAKQRPGPGQSPLLTQSPLGPPASSPIHSVNTPQSPLLSPSASPMMQHSSPMHSPAPIVSHSPGPGSVSSVLQSPNNQGSSMSPMQQSPRIGTPHSQSDGSPGPVQSPSQICLPPPAPRMTSPQHRRVVTSPIAYVSDMRPGTPQLRFTRPSIDTAALLQQRTRLLSPTPVFQQKPGTSSPLNSPPTQQMSINQQFLQRHLQQQALLQQQQQQSIENHGDGTITHSQRTLQMIQQRQIALRQQIVQGVNQPQPLTPHQHQLMVQQQQQLAKQQQQQIAQLQVQRISQHSQPPSSPMPPSPLVSQPPIMSPHSMHSQPASPMPPRSPMISHSPIPRSPALHQSGNQPPNSPMTHLSQPPSSPMPRSPMIGQIQSPMAIRRPPSTGNSPALPDRPKSVENPGTPRTPYTPQHLMEHDGGGGNPHNPSNPMPLLPGYFKLGLKGGSPNESLQSSISTDESKPRFGRFGYIKLGLRGGSPMWAYGRGAKRLPTDVKEQGELRQGPGETPTPPKFKKESHLSKVSILKKKSPIKSNLQALTVNRVNSLVSSDYNEFDDSSSTPPVTPPPTTSKLKPIGKKIVIDNEHKHEVIDGSPEGKHMRVEMMDYDDDAMVVSTEVSLSAAAQQTDGDDIIETFAQTDLPESFSSPLESDDITDDFLLFDISEGVHYSDKEDDGEEYVNINDKNMHIVFQSPTTSDEELIQGIQGKNKSVASDDVVGEAHERENEHQANDSANLSVVIVDPSVKSPEEISTKEDFEELIDEGSRKEKIIKPDAVHSKHINEIHKYAANVYSFPPKNAPPTSTSANTIIHANILSNIKSNTINIRSAGNITGQKILMTPVIKNSVQSLTPTKINLMKKDVVITTPPKLQTTNLANIILPLKTTISSVRSNVINVPKLVTSVSPAITIVSASTSQIASILPSHFTVPVLSASAVSKLPNVKVIEKPSTSLSLTTHDLPKKIFEDDSKSPDSSNCDDDRLKLEQHVNKIKDDLQNHEVNLQSEKRYDMHERQSKFTNRNDENENLSMKIEKDEKLRNLSRVENMKMKEYRVPSPVVRKNSPLIIHNPPELKMTAQVIQESQGGVITSRTVETMPFITTQTIEEADGGSNDKSVVISIPSPTPSQEQMLDNIALQALETRRQDGKYEYFDVLEMFEDNLIDKFKLDDIKKETPVTEANNVLKTESKKLEMQKKVETQTPVTVSTTTRPTVMPQLSPLSQPTELTTNMANVSQQLRTLLSSLNTTTVTTSSNVETVVTNITYKEKVSSATLASTISPATSRMVQPERISPVVSTTVIVPNKKVNNSPKTSPRIQSPVTLPQNTAMNLSTMGSTSVTSSLSISNLLPTRIVGGIQLMPDHPKLPPVAKVNSANVSNGVQLDGKTSVVTTLTTTPPLRKTSLSLNDMLQSHPAATMAQSSPGTITTASILGSPLSLSKSGFSAAALAQAQPHVVGSPVTSTVSLSTVNSPFRPVMSTTNLLHSQLTKGAVSRTKSLEDMLDKKKEIKSEVDVTSSITTITTSTLLKQENSGCKFSSIQLPNCNRIEDSQNVLLKQLLQNTACAGGQNVPTSTPSTTVTAVTAPALPIIPNLEAQLARPVPPTPSSLIPPILQNDSTSQSTKTQRPQIMSRETSFVSKPIQQPQQQQPAPPPPSPVVTSASHQLLHIDVKKSLPPSRTPSRDDLLSPPTPRSSCSQDSNLTTPPLVVKKEPIPTLASPLLTPQEVKKEFVDETSQHSEISDLSRYDVQLKEEMMDIDTEKSMDKEEVKKMKRRMYQQKRRQNQIMNKEVAGQPKKRPRKSSKVDEDYDAYVDGILAQMRNLPPMVVSEPVLNKNFAAVPVFGSGDLLKLGFKDYDSRLGDLNGMYGNALVPGFTDYYTTKPYGDSDPLPEKPPASTQRGFYDQEFSLICFDSDDDKRFDLFCRDDTPDSVISSSSPECPLFEPVLKFPGLKLIDEEDEDGDEEVSRCSRAMSPIVPIVAPIPIRLKPAGPYLKDYTDVDKENIGKDYLNLKSKFAPSPTTPLKDSGNVTVTLTLTSSAAEDIMGVLRDLANILHIPAPTSYQIVERTSTPPSQKLGLYRTKGKDGKEGAPIDIQSILNGAAKFCKHCDVVILSNMIRKKIAELPFLSKDTELLGDGEELFFCSSGCYTQFALMHRSPSLTEDKAAAIVDHICQRDKADLLRKRQVIERQRAELFALETVTRKQPHYLEKMDIDLHIKKEDFSDEMRIDFMKPDSFLSRFGEHKKSDELHSQMRWKNVRYKHFTSGCLHPAVRHKKPTDKEIMELLYKLGVTVVPVKNVEDTRKCMFCHNIRDGVGDGPARLLNFDVDKWVHLNCGLWSDGVYETVNGALMNLENALQHSLVSTCILCSKLGATLRCFKARCTSVYHLSCAIKDGCVFYKNKTMFCTMHIPKGEKDNELTTLSVSRRVYVNRDENRQVAAVMHHSDQNNLLRVGSLIFLSVGQLLPHQLQNFHTSNFIYPIGYKIIRFYWSMRHVNKRCRYVCSIHEVSGRPEFRILAQEMYEDDLEFRDITAKGVWNKVLESIAHIRRENQCVQIFPKFVTGEDLFGLTEPAVVRVLESLPGIETLTDYKFKYGRNPLLELPLAINPSGAARTEPRLRNQLHWKRAHTQRTGSSARPVFVPTASGSGEAACPYSKQFVHSKSSQYKKMKQEWRNNVYLARSKIQGLGLYAARDLEKHTMVIEYIGEIIRTELAETREKQYEARNRGIYMFRLDEERVVDATLCGGLARYINHSCNPNCVAEIVEVDRDLRIIIFAKRRIQRGEELAYDYKFDIEDDQHKISCMCGAPNCRKWMN